LAIVRRSTKATDSCLASQWQCCFSFLQNWLHPTKLAESCLRC
jgi:hypothetical protein